MSRHVVPRRSLGVAVLAALSFLVPHAAAAQPAEWVRVLRQDDAGVELLLVAPEPDLVDGRVGVRGFAAGGTPGYPELFEQAAFVGVPGPRGARLEVLETTPRDLGRVVPHIQPAPSSYLARRDDEAAGRPIVEWRSVPAVRLTGVYPDAVVDLGGTAKLRDRDVVVLRFRPVQYRPGDGATFVGSARVRITWADRPRRRPPGRGAAEPLDAALVNASSVAAWEPAPAKPAPRPARVLPAERLRIRIEQRGILELVYADLRAAGVPVDRSDFDPRTLRLFVDSWQPVALYADSAPGSWQGSWEMQEAAIWVPGEEDFSFDPDDRVVFYGLGPQGYEDLAGASTDSLRYFRHPYDRASYAWLVWDGEFGRRWSPQAATPADTAAAITAVWHREHQEQDLAFDAVDDLWYWREIREQSPQIQQRFSLDLGGPATATGTLRIVFGYGEPGYRHVIHVSLNGQPLGDADFFQGGSAGRAFTFAGAPLQAGNNDVVAVLDTALSSTHTTELLEFDVTWDRPLAAGADGVLGWSTRPASGDTEVYALSGFGATPPLLLDVTDWLAPSALTGLAAAGTGASTVWRAEAGRGLGRRVHYLAARAPVRVASRNLTLRTVAPLRDRGSAPDMLIVTHESLRGAAERLASHRRAHWPGGGSPDILVTTTGDIYENFSGGRLDPLAIRNYAKFLYRLDPTPRLRYVLLFGDGSRDMRQLLQSSAPTLVPTLEPHYADERFVQAYAVDDWLAELDTPRNGSTPFPVPDLALGRLTARGAADAERMVDKIVAYETTSGFGTWRRRVLMAGDDECHPLGGCGETYHIGNTEELVRLVPRDLDVVKLYLTEYPAVLGQKPQARAAFIRAWSEGCMLLNYQGHGAPRQIADEVLFLSTDVPALTNGSKLPIFLPISCTVSEFDVPDRQSMCEDLMASTSGGAIATVGATTPTYVGPNFSFNVQMFREVFHDGATSHIPVGIVYQLAKIHSPVDQGRFNETYVLLGDPSMPLVLPEALVRFTSGADTLRTGNRARVEGEVYAPADSLRLAGFQGSVEVEVRGTADESGYRRTSPPLIYIPYDLPGTPFYRGTVAVVDGRFAFQFIVPVGARAGNKARIGGYAASTATDATGIRDAVRVVVAAAGDSSRAAPRIRLRFPNDRTRVKAGTPLTAEIVDENGVNIQGTSLRNSILLDFDRRNEPLDVTVQFRYAAGSDSAGAVTVSLPSDLEPGAHTATLIASDNLQNTATASLEFQVVEADVVRLVNVLAFPNPFRDRTHFFFEITDPAEVEVRVFTTSGREVWHRRQRVETGAQGSIKWDGVDLQEDTLANGTYLYRIRAKPDRAGSPTLEHIGKIVIMR